MNSSSLAATLHQISTDRQRALAHQKMVRIWAALAGALILYLLGSRAFGWNSPVFIPGILLVGAIAWITVKRSVANLQVSLLDIAREVEAGDARLNSLLLAAYEEQQKAGNEGLSYLQERVIVEALEANRRSPWGQQFAEARFFKAAKHAGSFAAFLIALALTILIGPRGNILTAILGGVEVTPGTTEIERGTALAVMAKFPEPAPPEVRMVIRPKNGPLRVVAMDRALADPVFGASLAEVQEDFAYHVEYKGKKTPEYQISVFEYPTLKRADAKLTFPEFTKLGEKKIDDTRRVSAVEGTVVDYRLELNKPVKSASLVTKAGEKVELRKDDKFANVYHAKIDLRESLKAALVLKDEAGRTNKAVQEFALDALPNKAPDMKVVFPRGDQRISALEEVSMAAEIRDDFGLGAYGLGYALGGGEPKYVKLGDKGNANEKKALAHLLRVEEMAASTDQLISYFAWAEDLGPDGKVRRTESDMYFAEVRPFEEIYRQGSRNQQQQQQGGGGGMSPGEQLGELQKQIISATWNIQRREASKPTPKYKEDISTVRESQSKALGQADELIGKMTDPRTKALAEAAKTEMQKAVDKLSDAVSSKSTEPLPQALSAERAAYQALLKLQAREYSVSRQRQQQAGGGGGQQRGQRQMDELDLKDEEDRYETATQASPQNAEQKEQLQALNKLKELARRQGDINERLKELQAALQEAKTEEEKEELRRRLKRLQEEQQEAVRDMDELQQQMAQAQNQSQMAEARQQLDQARQQAQKAGEQMRENSLGQAQASSARTEKDLKKLTEDFRKATAQQFNDEMRDMRREARDLAQKEKEIAEKIQDLKTPKQKTLSDAGGKDELSRQLSQQKTNYANILERMKQVSEKAEQNEPLLSQKLYDTVRQLNQQNTEQALDNASEFLRRSFLPQASQLEEKARQGIEQMREGVDQAARRLLGDEAEALRTAGRELDDLARRLQGEASSRRTNSIASGPQNEPGERGTNRIAAANAPEGSETNSPAPGNRGERQIAQGGQRSRQQNQGRQPGQRGQAGQQQSDQSEQEGEQNGQQEGQQAGQNRQGGRPQNRQAQSGEQRQIGGGNFYDRPQYSDQPGSGPAEQERPLTGNEYRRWADRLRDVQEMIDDPDLRNQLAQAMDRARAMRSEFVRHSKEPQWDMVQNHVLKPLTEVRQRVAEELARRDASAVAPLDRDPVPGRYAELVSRYYKSLGQNAPSGSAQPEKASK